MKTEILIDREYMITDSDKNKWNIFIDEIDGHISGDIIEWITFPKGIHLELLDDSGCVKEYLHCNGVADIPDRFPQHEVNDLEFQIQSDLMVQAGYEGIYIK